MSEYTKGPWKISSEDAFCSVITDGTGSTLAEVEIECVNEFDDFIHKFSKPEGRANARIMAAAPQLYETLKAWMEYETGPSLHSYAEIRAMYDAAIAKAEGRP
jgi:hypothetical protein